ncbi:aminotransferase [Irpex lacteus]|nr:aminotransferase [Irpex lacteus]
MTTLDRSLSKALNDRAAAGNSLADFLNPLLSTRSDFFSNDYLSLDCDPQIHAGLIPHLRGRSLLGSRGTRSLSGSTLHHVELERYFRTEYNAPATLLFNSGYMANITILGSLPQRHDVIVYDELVHASCHDGMRMSRAKGAMFSFTHNSPEALASRLRQVAEECENVRLGLSTVFIVLESIYSMDGNFCPLREMIEVAEAILPAGVAHIVVDEAHSHGILGPQGKGLVSLLNLSDRVQSVVLPFTKGHNYFGAVVLTSLVVCQYIINFGRPFMYGTSLPHVDLLGIRYCYEFVKGAEGAKRRERLLEMSRLFHRTLTDALKDIPPRILLYPHKNQSSAYPELISPIFPIMSSRAVELQRHLNGLGYAAQAITFPVVPKGKGRIRVVVHSGNTKEEIQEFAKILREWAAEVQGLTVARVKSENTFRPQSKL